MTCQRLEGHSLSLSFQLLFTTQPWALLNNRKNVIWLLFKARRYHSLWPTMAANRTRGLGGYKGAHSKRCLLSSTLDTQKKPAHTLRPEEVVQPMINWGGSWQSATHWPLTSAVLSAEPVSLTQHSSKHSGLQIHSLRWHLREDKWRIPWSSSLQVIISRWRLQWAKSCFYYQFHPARLFKRETGMLNTSNTWFQCLLITIRMQQH